MTLIYLTLKPLILSITTSSLENDFNLPNSQTYCSRETIEQFLRMTLIYLTLKQFTNKAKAIKFLRMTLIYLTLKPQIL